MAEALSLSLSVNLNLGTLAQRESGWREGGREYSRANLLSFLQRLVAFGGRERAGEGATERRPSIHSFIHSLGGQSGSGAPPALLAYTCNADNNGNCYLSLSKLHHLQMQNSIHARLSHLIQLRTTTHRYACASCVS